MVDKNFCMSSYLAFRYIEDEDKDFFEGLRHCNFIPALDEDKTLVRTAKEIDVAIQKVFEDLKDKKLGLMLSGGMDSAILASYMSGCDAYTFRFLGGEFQKEELRRARHYAEHYDLRLHYVDIDWNVVEQNIDPLMHTKGAPVHSIEPQLFQAAIQAKRDGVQKIVVGESADLLFGGMDLLLGKDWTFDDFVKRYMFTNPYEVLNDPVDVTYLFERFRQGDNIDFLSFMDHVFSIESSGSYMNAFEAAEMPYTDPYAILKMADPIDLTRIRHGESKYLIRELFTMKYPEIPVPEKIPMPRPVDIYFKDWKGPVRKEFRRDLDMSKFTGNQKWQLWCLERFLNMMEP